MSQRPQCPTSIIRPRQWLLPCALWCACTGVALAAAPIAAPVLKAASQPLPQIAVSAVKPLKIPVQGVAATVKPKLLPRPAAGASPTTSVAAKVQQKSVSGGDDDLNDLEVERHKRDAASKLSAGQLDTGRGIVPLPRPQLQK